MARNVAKLNVVTSRPPIASSEASFFLNEEE